MEKSFLKLFFVVGAFLFVSAGKDFSIIVEDITVESIDKKYVKDPMVDYEETNKGDTLITANFTLLKQLDKGTRVSFSAQPKKPVGHQFDAGVTYTNELCEFLYQKQYKSLVDKALQNSNIPKEKAKCPWATAKYYIKKMALPTEAFKNLEGDRFIGEMKVHTLTNHQIAHVKSILKINKNRKGVKNPM